MKDKDFPNNDHGEEVETPLWVNKAKVLLHDLGIQSLRVPVIFTAFLLFATLNGLKRLDHYLHGKLQWQTDDSPKKSGGTTVLRACAERLKAFAAGVLEVTQAKIKGKGKAAQAAEPEKAEERSTPEPHQDDRGTMTDEAVAIEDSCPAEKSDRSGGGEQQVGKS